MKDAVKKFFEGKIYRDDFLKELVNSLKKRCFLSGEFPNLTNKIEHDTDKILPDFCEFFPKIRTLGYIPLKYGTDDREHVALFAVTCAKELSERSYRRKQFDFAQKIAVLPGQIRIWFDANHSLPSNAIFLFIAPDGKSFRLSLIERDKSKEKKIFKRYTFFVSADQRNRTFFARIGSDKKWETFSDLRETFSVEKLSDDFFKAYTETHYQAFVSYATGVRMGYKGKEWVVISRTEPNQEIMEQFASYADPDKALRDYVKKMMGRLVFLQFLQKKGWLGVPEGAEWGNGDKEYLKKLFDSSRYQDDFLEKVLEPLFFETLNKDRRPEKDIADAVLAVNDGKVRIPYLNGGLFEKDELDKAKIKFPPKYFSALFDTFERYNFTIDENDPDDKEVGVDPEMLGRIFENLLEDNKDKGAFYTPKEIVQYMCEESLIAYLGDTEANRKLVKDFDVEDITDPKALLEKLEDVKICDPAIGSGAFPMGMLNILYRLRLILEGKEFSPANIVKVKKEIIQNNIYGVDIEAGAVDIARLRFWLSIVVDEDKPIPLPNLDYKIMQGNSLLEQYNGVDLSQICNKFMVSESSVSQKKKSKKKQADDDEASLLELFDDTLCTPDIMHKAMDYYFSIQQHNLKEQYKDRINGKVLNCIKTALKQDSVEIDWNNAPFFLWHTYFWDVFDKKGGFDIVIGNPPYLKEGRISKTLFAQYKKDPYYEGKMDLWQIFACQGIDMLNPAGHLCFIATNNWITNSGAKKMWNKIISDAQIKQMIDFGTYMVFKDGDKKKDGPSIQTMIMLFGKDSKFDNYAFDWRYLKDGATKADMNELLLHTNNQFTVYKKPIINRKSLKNKLLTFSGADDLLNKFASNKDYLKDNEATNGIHTHFDCVEKKHLSKDPSLSEGEGIFSISHEEKSKLSLSEEELTLIKPYYTTEQVKKYITYQDNNLWLIYTDSTFKDPCSMDSYPRLKAHLDKFHKIISSDNKPYGLHRARKEQFFNGEKIIVLRKCANKPSFSYNDFSCYVPATFYVIQTTRWNMKFLTGLLNSKLIAYWLRHKGKMQGNNYQIDKAPLLGIPLVKPSTNDQKQLADLVDKIRQQKEQNIDADISELEKEIDDIVYSLYGLTDEEISIIDESLKKPVAAEGKKQRGKKAAAVPAEPVINDDYDEDDGDL